MLEFEASGSWIDGTAKKMSAALDIVEDGYMFAFTIVMNALHYTGIEQLGWGNVKVQ